jgi:2-haloacid dehalogenase
MPDIEASKIEAVVFDVGNVLVRWDRSLPFLDRFDSEAELERFLDEVIPLAWHAQHDAGLSAAEMVAERAERFPDYAEPIGEWFTRFNETIPGPVTGMPEIVAALAARSVPLYAITNFGADTWAGFLPEFTLASHFRDTVVSGIEKLMKPDPAIFALAARRFGHAPERMLFVDDSLANVESARACGWQAHHFVDSAGLEADLRMRKLL